jgi:Fe-S cluster biosynthesis and repair protein YggX
MEEINLRKFDIKKMIPSPVCVLIAKRNSGKSFLIRDIMSHNRDIPAGSVISRTDKVAHFYDKFIPSILIHDSYKSELLQKIFDRQKKSIKEGWKNKRFFLIFDDVLSEANTWKKDPLLQDVFFNGRHYNILFLLAMQAPMGIVPALRSNIDYTFILKTSNHSDRKKLYEHYAGVFPSMAVFEKVLDACTENYGCLVIDNTVNTNSISEQVFFYRADDHKEFLLCDERFWVKDNDKKNKPPVNPQVVKNINVKKVKF